MAEINFLEQNQDKNKDEKKAHEPDLPGDFKWTSPAGEEAPASPPPPGAVKPASNPLRPVQKPSAAPAPVQDKTGPAQDKPSGLSGLLARWRRKAKDSPGKSGGLGEKKELLAKSNDVFNEEKNLRRGNAAIRAAKDNNGRSEKFVSEDDDQWRAPKVLKTNLMEGEVISFLNWRESARGFFAVILITGFLVGAAYAGLLYWEMRAFEKSHSLAVEIESVKQRVARAESNLENVNLFQKKLALAGTLLKNHVYWTNFFKLIEEYTMADVFYEGGFSGDTAGKYSFSATAGSYQDITDQITAFKQSEQVLSATVRSGSLTGGGEGRGAGYAVGFRLELEIDPSVFRK